MARKTAVWISTSFLICSLGSCLYIPGPGTCFPSGTEVLTSAGPLAIEKVEPGTDVYSYESATGEWKLK